MSLGDAVDLESLLVYFNCMECYHLSPTQCKEAPSFLLSGKLNVESAAVAVYCCCNTVKPTCDAVTANGTKTAEC